MKPNDAAKALLERISLPKGVVTILPWQEDGHVVMRVLVEKRYAKEVDAPREFEGYPVVVAERLPAVAYH
jgi:hypothetical protein